MVSFNHQLCIGGLHIFHFDVKNDVNQQEMQKRFDEILAMDQRVREFSVVVLFYLFSFITNQVINPNVS